jgi:hypothetical protein
MTLAWIVDEIGTQDHLRPPPSHHLKRRGAYRGKIAWSQGEEGCLIRYDSNPRSLEASSLLAVVTQRNLKGQGCMVAR